MALPPVERSTVRRWFSLTAVQRGGQGVRRGSVKDLLASNPTNSVSASIASLRNQTGRDRHPGAGVDHPLTRLSLRVGAGSASVVGRRLDLFSIARRCRGGLSVSVD